MDPERQLSGQDGNVGNSDRKLKKTKEKKRKEKKKREKKKKKKRTPREKLLESVSLVREFMLWLMVSGSGECHAPSYFSFLFFLLLFHLSLTAF